MRYHFVRDHRDQFQVSVMCRVLNVSRGGYYAWLSRPESTRKSEDRAIAKKIKPSTILTDTTLRKKL